ncbi:MAG: hypothetical protein AAFN92_16975 [Bacteroidota bacterium]
MSKAKHITSLNELKQRQRELDLEVEVSKREFSHSVGASRENLGDFLLKSVALPVGGLILGVYLTRKVLRSRPEPEVIYEKEIVHEVAPPPPAPRAVATPPPRQSKPKLENLMKFGRLAIPMAHAIYGVINKESNK